MDVILKNREHPECGELKVHFPLENVEYDAVLTSAKRRGMGSALECDCLVDRMDTPYPMLKNLEGQAVNMDELDYLAKRLDSFDYYEMQQFQALCFAEEIGDVSGMINLSFDCQQVTVITDFTDLRQAGIDHCMARNGGCASTKDIEAVEGYPEITSLIQQQSGKITPFGVLYANDMELSYPYKGKEFPQFAYKPPVLEVEIAGDDGVSGGKWLALPMPNMMLEHYTERMGLETYAEILYAESNLPGEMNTIIDISRDKLYEVNRLCQAVERLSEQDVKKLTAVSMMAKAIGAKEHEQLAMNLDFFEFVPDVKDPEEYGRYMIQESGRFEFDPNLEDYYNYAGYADARIEEYEGVFTSLGYVAYTGAMPLEELLHGGTSEQPFQMGGMKM